MKMGWLLGWAIPEKWFAPLATAAFPDVVHRYFPATPDAVTQLQAAGPFDRVVGYSLGSLLLLQAAARGVACGEVTLLAPVFAFPREENLGGKIARAHVRQLSRWLRRDAGAALNDFYQRAGLDISPEPRASDAIENLLWGLERLEQDRAVPHLPAGWRAWCGADDALLDAPQLAGSVSGVAIVAGGTHHPAGLLRAMAEGRS